MTTEIHLPNFSYHPSSILGHGSTGTVFSGTRKSDNKPVAIKVINLKQNQNDVTKFLLEGEKKVLRKLLNKKNLMQLIDIIQNQEYCYIITEIYKNGTLKEYITQKGYLPIQQCLQLFTQILTGYLSLSQCLILHRDLKPTNIMLTQSSSPIIIDFGYSQIIQTSTIMRAFNVGSPSYMAPQAYTKTLYSQKSDLWALGVILYEMVTGKVLDDGLEVKEYFGKLNDDRFVIKKLEQIQNRIVYEILSQVLKIQPSQRISGHKMKYIIDKSIIQKIQNNNNNNHIKDNHNKSNINRNTTIISTLNLSKRTNINQSSTISTISLTTTTPSITNNKTNLNYNNNNNPLCLLDKQKKLSLFNTKLTQSRYKLINQNKQCNNNNNIINNNNNININNISNNNNNNINNIKINDGLIMKSSGVLSQMNYNQFIGKNSINYSQFIGNNKNYDYQSNILLKHSNLFNSNTFNHHYHHSNNNNNINNNTNNTNYINTTNEYYSNTINTLKQSYHHNINQLVVYTQKQNNKYIINNNSINNNNNINNNNSNNNMSRPYTPQIYQKVPMNNVNYNNHNNYVNNYNSNNSTSNNTQYNTNPIHYVHTNVLQDKNINNINNINRQHQYLINNNINNNNMIIKQKQHKFSFKKQLPLSSLSSLNTLSNTAYLTNPNNNNNNLNNNNNNDINTIISPNNITIQSTIKPFTPINQNISKMNKQNKYMTIQSKHTNINKKMNNYQTPYYIKQQIKNNIVSYTPGYNNYNNHQYCYQQQYNHEYNMNNNNNKVMYNMNKPNNFNQYNNNNKIRML